MTTPLIYVAGPYRARTAWRREVNIHRARAAGVLVAKAGGYPVIPHSNTAHFDDEADDSLWLAGSLELMRRCDGMLVVDTFDDEGGESLGTRREIEEARVFCIPVAYLRAIPEEDKLCIVAGWIKTIEQRLS
jgi:hypothetical protein